MEQAAQNTIQIHDVKAYEELFRTHYANLCSYAYKYIENMDEAEEIVQDVFVKFWENRNSIEINNNFQSYIFRAVRNSCLNLIKHKNIREAYKVETRKSIFGQHQNLEDEILYSELELKIREAIELLPKQRRKVFIMSRYEGLKYREIADKLDISIKTVDKQMGKALKFLKVKLAKYIIIYIIYITKILVGSGWM